MQEFRALIGRAAATSIFWISLALLLLVVLFAVISPSGTFLTGFNAQTIASDASVLLILATGMTLVIVSGGIDLSMGSVMTFSGVIGIVSMKGIGDAAGGGWTAVAIGTGIALLCSVGWGAINGALIAYARLPAFVVTLGSLGAALGAARLVSDGVTVSGAPSVLQTDIGLSTPAGIPTPFIFGIAIAGLFSVVMAVTRFGEHVHLVGSNEEGARRGGIPNRWVLFRVYVLSGLLAGLAGVLDLARFDAATVSTGHLTDLVAALAAVIIGGASLLGGTGLIVGSVIGVFIPVVLNNGFVILGVQPFWHEIVVGIVLVAAVALDQLRRTAALRPGPTPDRSPSASERAPSQAKEKV